MPATPNWKRVLVRVLTLGLAGYPPPCDECGQDLPASSLMFTATWVRCFNCGLRVKLGPGLVGFTVLDKDDSDMVRWRSRQR